MPSNAQYHHDYYERNKAKRIEAVKKWREENPKKYKTYNDAYQKEHRKDLPKELKEIYTITRILKECQKTPKKRQKRA